MRGEVWDAHFPTPVGDHPVVILTSSALISRLSSVTVALVTGTEGPDAGSRPARSRGRGEQVRGVVGERD